MRKTYHYDPVTKEMVAGPSPHRSSTSVLNIPDIPDFVSPIDGRVVNGRAGLREHNKEHNVTNVADFKDEWAQKAKERESMYSGDTKFDRERRVDAIKRALERHNVR